MIAAGLLRADPMTFRFATGIYTLDRRSGHKRHWCAPSVGWRAREQYLLDGSPQNWAEKIKIV